MPGFLHGVQVVEVDSGAHKMQTASSSVIGLIGTAPNADAQKFPLNTPILIAGSEVEAAALGEGGTLLPSLRAILAQVSASVVVVRVEEVLPTDETDDQIAAAKEAQDLLVAGEVSSNGEYVGASAFLLSKNNLGISPRILIAPGFNSDNVVEAMKIIAERLRAIVVVDAPESDNGSETALNTFVTNHASSRIFAVYPKVFDLDVNVVPLSPYVAGVISRTDNDEGFWVSPSNKVINGIIGLGTNVDFIMGDAGCKANHLNEIKISTVINQNGFRLWGNRTTEDGKYSYLCVRRTADIISESILQSHLWAVDRNITVNYLDEVENEVNAFLSNLKAQGAILSGKCWASKELNTTQAIVEGKVYFDFDFTPTYPAEHVTFRAYLNNDDIESLLIETLR